MLWCRLKHASTPPLNPAIITPFPLFRLVFPCHFKSPKAVADNRFIVVQPSDVNLVEVDPRIKERSSSMEKEAVVSKIESATVSKAEETTAAIVARKLAQEKLLVRFLPDRRRFLLHYCSVLVLLVSMGCLTLWEAFVGRDCSLCAIYVDC